jgi:hypothetical protein
MLHPTHPARFAVGLRGGRFSITVSEKKTLGTSRRFLMSQSAEYCSTRRFGTLSERIARTIDS